MRDIEKRALSEGLIKPEAIFEWPKVVINVRLMTEPLMNHDFEDDESLTLMKFKTFQVRLFEFRWHFTHICFLFFAMALADKKSA